MTKKEIVQEFCNRDRVTPLLWVKDSCIVVKNDKYYTLTSDTKGLVYASRNNQTEIVGYLPQEN